MRAVGSIILGSNPVAVENHLIVVKPKRGGIKECEFLLNNLRNAQTKTWLDERIRCRHLTVGVLRELPVGRDMSDERLRFSTAVLRLLERS